VADDHDEPRRQQAHDCTTNWHGTTWMPLTRNESVQPSESARERLQAEKQVYEVTLTNAT